MTARSARQRRCTRTIATTSGAVQRVGYSRRVVPRFRRTVAAVPTKRSRRFGVLALILAPFALSGCTLPSFGAAPGATTEARQTYHLWQGFTIGAIIVGGITLSLILFAMLRYRARKGDESIPRQSQYHLPLEITYTVIPIIIVLVLFAFTVVVEDNVTALPTPATTIHVQAYQWGWRFNYPGFTIAGQTIYHGGPTMVMPDHENVQIVLTSNDVVHGFYVRQFNFSRYALPGVTNKFTFNATSPGDYFGQCTQLCGLEHALMWFHVKVVSQSQFAAWEKSQQTKAAALALAAAELASRQQTGTGVKVKPYIGGGTN